MQAVLEEALRVIMQSAITVEGSGRTDAGAHALGQVVAFSADTAHPPRNLLRALNANLPDDIAVTEVAEVDPAFHPRYDASSRTYRYLIWNRPVHSPFWEGRAAYIRPPLDISAMQQAADLLVGRQDFSAFVPVRHSTSRERTMFRADCSRDGDLVAVELECSGFMRQMVRAISGTLIQVGLGRMTLAEFATIFNGRDRRLAAETAPAQGLYLVSVQYPKEDRALAGPAPGKFEETE